MNDLETELRATLRAKSDGVSRAMLRPVPEQLDHDVVADHGRTVIRLEPDARRSGPRRWATGLVAATVAAVLAIAIGITVAGRGDRSGSGPVSPALGRSQVPWSQVGANWTLVVAAAGTSATKRDLLLIAPTGTRYLISRLPMQLVNLQPWTATTGKAILTAEGTEQAINDVLIIDLHSGAQTKTTVPTHFTTVQFTTPQSDRLLVTNGAVMQTVSVATGRTLVRYSPADPGGSGLAFGSAISPNGSQVATGGMAGLSVFDLTSGRRIRQLPKPAGYDACFLTGWLGGGQQLMAECLAQDRGINFTFAGDGRTAPRRDPVPAGWREIRIAHDAIAYQHTGLDQVDPSKVAFARVNGTGRLVPVGVPAELKRGGWQLTGAAGDLLLFEDSIGSNVVEIAAWNPVSDTFTGLIAAGPDQRPNFLHSSWQELRA